MSIQQIKACIRGNILSQRRLLSPDKQAHASQQVCQKIQVLSAYQQAHHVGFYYPFKQEIDLSLLWDPFPQNKTCYLPTCSATDSLLFYPFTATTCLRKNQWGIPEPSVETGQSTQSDIIDVIFIPLLAFDMHGTRLGMGGGYYDRTLATNNRSLRIGIAYEFQKQAYLPADPWDKPMHAVVTDMTTYWFSNPTLL